MIKRPGQQQLLLPVSPVFMWSSLVVALLVNMVPVGRAVWMPDLLALVIVFWGVHQPTRVGIGAAFVFGLCMDVHQSAMLGQHALSYTTLGFFAITIHRRLLWYPVLSQALQVLPLFALSQLIEVVTRHDRRRCVPGLGGADLARIEAALWPLVSALLLAPQRRTPEPDENRPL
jgi:rod shape-determining protein MreD